MSSNLENSSGVGETYQYDQSQYFASDGQNVFDPALLQQDSYHNYNSNAMQPISRGLAQDADPQDPRHHIAFPDHWHGHAAPENGAHAYNVNQFDDQFYPNDAFSSFPVGEPSTNYFNQPQFQQSQLNSEPQYAQQYAWHSYGTASAALQHQNIAPGELQNNQSKYHDDPGTPTRNFQTGPQQLSNDRPSIPQSQNRSQGTTPDLPTHWSLPPGERSGKFVITAVEDLEQMYNCEKLSSFVCIGKESKETPITKLALPAYVRRKSRNQIAELLAKDSNLKSKNNKKIRTSAASLSQPNKSQKENRKIASTASATQDASDDVDSDSSSSEDEQPPLPAVRPTDKFDAEAYDTTQATWRPRYRTATSDDIRTGLMGFSEQVGSIRRRWKSDAEAVEAAVAKKNRDLPMLRERVSIQRQLFEVVMKTALKDGHRDIIEHFGRHLPIIVALSAALVDLAKEFEWNTDLAKSILELLSRCCARIDGSIVKKTNLLKVVTRFSKRGDDVVKSFTTIIIGCVTPALEKHEKEKEQEAKNTSANAAPSSTSSSKTKKSSAVTGSPIAGAKRPREDDASATNVSKKATGSGLNKGKDGAVTKSSTGPENKTTSNPVPTKKATTKPENVFASLQPAYKKSTAANAITSSVTNPRVAPAASKLTVPTMEKKSLKPTSESSAPTPFFSFSQAMATITKPKEVEQPAKKKENTPPETEEEKSRRLRKEKRRGLRVSFKPDNELVQVRVFEHHPDEEVTHNASEVRDVKDLEGEGRMFKLKQQAKQQQLKNHPDSMDLDDEDEEDEDSDGGLDKEYIPPSQIDFSDVPETAREQNYAPLGGGMVAVHSPEAEQQLKRETDTLLVVYAQSSDIPPSPKEPQFEERVNRNPTPFGSPHGHVLSRLASSPGAQQTTNPVNVSSLLESLGFPQNFPPQQVQPQPETSGSFDLNQIIAHLSQRQEQPQQTTQFQPSSDSSLQQHWDPVASVQSSYAPQAPAVQQIPHAPPPSSEVNISAILESIKKGLGGIPQTQSSIMNPVATPAAQQQSQIYENEDRRRLREGAGPDQTNQQQQQSQAQQGQTKKNTRHFIYPCKFFQEGKCIKGKNCTYIHEQS